MGEGGEWSMVTARWAESIAKANRMIAPTTGSSKASVCRFGDNRSLDGASSVRKFECPIETQLRTAKKRVTFMASLTAKGHLRN
jgi:hypothetical protein